MAGVIVQSKATSHVYRIFSALVVLLLLMAFAIGLSRLRSDQQGGSPYGALTALAPTAPQDPVPAAALTAVIHAKTAAPPVAEAAPSASAPAAIAVAAPPQTSLAPPASPAPVDMLALADPGKGGPRRIALDRAAAGAAAPQPAPAAVVTAAAKSMTVPRVAPPAAPAASSMAAIAPSAPATAPAPAAVTQPPAPKAQAPARKVAAAEDDGDAPDKPHANAAGRININHASVDEMNHLGAGHIGAAIARGRPYRSIDDLVSRRVLKARDLARIEAGITAN